MLVAAAAGLMVCAPLSAQAADYTWKGGGGNNLWANAKNWTPMRVPGVADTATIGGTAQVQVPTIITVKNLRLGSDAVILNSGKINVTGWTSSDGVMEGVGELRIPAGAAATINLNATTLARNPSYAGAGGAWCAGGNIQFGKINSSGKLNVTVTSSVNVEFADVTNNGGETVLHASGAAVASAGPRFKGTLNPFCQSSAQPIKLKALKNEKGTLTLKGTGRWGRAFAGEAIVNEAQLVFDSVRTLTQNDYNNKAGAKILLKNNSLLTCVSGVKKMENEGVFESEGYSEVRMEWLNKGQLIVGTGKLTIAPPDGKTAEQDGGTTTLKGGTLEILDSTSDASKKGLLMKGGVLDGSGDINGDVRNEGGSLKVGHSPGLMTINGNYTQTANGLMHMEVWGTTAGSLYDQLLVRGNAYLNGTLLVDYGNGFIPDKFAFYHVRYVQYFGKFSSVRVNNPAPGRYYRLLYSTSGVYSSTSLLANPTSPPSFYGISYKPVQPKQYVRGL